MPAADHGSAPNLRKREYYPSARPLRRASGWGRSSGPRARARFLCAGRSFDGPSEWLMAQPSASAIWALCVGRLGSELPDRLGICGWPLRSPCGESPVPVLCCDTGYKIVAPSGSSCASPRHLYQAERVLPAGISVTAAARKLGVGRPALSNLLNGNASLSSDMAMRLEKAFGASSEALLRMQAAYDQSLARAREPEIAVQSYAPSFLDIRARQIQAWASGLQLRAELPRCSCAS